MRLYELDESMAILEDLMDRDAIDEDMLGLALESLGQQVEDKMERIGKLVRNWQAESEALDAEIKRLRDRQMAIDSKVSRLRQYALQSLRAANLRRIKLPILTAYIGSSKRVEVLVEPDELPLAYQRITVGADRAALKTALEAGEVIEGAELVESEYLVVR